MMKYFFFFVLLWGSIGMSMYVSAFSRKDDLFSTILVQKEGVIRTIEYSQQRDLYQRDEIPVDRVKSEYVDTAIIPLATEGVHNGYAYHEIGVGHEFAIIYIYGLGGNKSRGRNDWTFGGNFNRVKNLAVRYNGRYIVPDLPSFAQGANHVAGIITKIRTQNPAINIIVACGSSGGEVCWDLYQQVQTPLHGLILLGSTIPDAAILPLRRIPIFWGHGMSDRSINYRPLVSFVEKRSDRYPFMVDLYQSGVHGTPVRMVDWALVLEWMFSL